MSNCNTEVDLHIWDDRTDGFNTVITNIPIASNCDDGGGSIPNYLGIQYNESIFFITFQYNASSNPAYIDGAQISQLNNGNPNIINEPSIYQGGIYNITFSSGSFAVSYNNDGSWGPVVSVSSSSDDQQRPNGFGNIFLQIRNSKLSNWQNSGQYPMPENYIGNSPAGNLYNGNIYNSGNYDSNIDGYYPCGGSIGCVSYFIPVYSYYVPKTSLSSTISPTFAASVYHSTTN